MRPIQKKGSVYIYIVMGFSGVSQDLTSPSPVISSSSCRASQRRLFRGGVRGPRFFTNAIMPASIPPRPHGLPREDLNPKPSPRSPNPQRFQSPGYRFLCEPPTLCLGFLGLFRLRVVVVFHLGLGSPWCLIS